MSKWVGKKKIKTYKSNFKKKLNANVKNCGSFKSFGYIYRLLFPKKKEQLNKNYTYLDGSKSPNG